MATEPVSLHKLLHKGRVWRGNHAPEESVAASCSSGFPQLDAMLPGKGWQDSQLVELLYSEEGSGELGLLLPLLAELSRQERWLLWVDPPHIPYAPALQEAGVNLDRIQVVRSNSRRDRLWCLEQSMRSGCCSAVLGWLPAGQEKAIRRLQVAAVEGECRGFLFRHSRCQDNHSAASCRLLLEPHEEGVTVSVLKRRGGWPLPPRLIPVSSVASTRTDEEKAERPRLSLVRNLDEQGYEQSGG